MGIGLTLVFHPFLFLLQNFHLDDHKYVPINHPIPSAVIIVSKCN